MSHRDQHTRLTVITPVFDEAPFDELIDDLESSTDALDFVVTFTSMLGSRIARIAEFLAQDGQDGENEQDREHLEEALLSLRAGAAMAGARRLEILATTALTDMTRGRVAGRPLVQQLHREARAFKAVTARLAHPSAHLAA